MDNKVDKTDPALTILNQKLPKDELVIADTSTAGDIWRMCNENPEFPNCHSFARFLSRKWLDEYEAFCKIQPELRAIITSHLKKQNPLRIRSKSLINHPIERNNKLYTTYGAMTSKIIIDGIAGDYLADLLDYFPKLQSIVLINITILDNDDYEDYPSSMRSIAFVKCRIEERCTWFKRMKCLESLSISANENDVHLDTTFPKLKSLTIQNQTVTGVPKCPVLKDLKIDFCWKAIAYEAVKAFPKLESLYVTQSIDWTQKEQIDALNLKSVSLQHVFEKPTENLLLTLVDDCLLYLRQFLPSNDFICLQITHPRLLSFKTTALDIDKDTLKRIPWPKNREFYTQLGSSVKELDIICIPEKALNGILPLFTELTLLDICYDRSSGTGFLSRIPTGLKKLYISGRMIENAKATEDLFRRLNPSLEILHIEYKAHGELREAEENPFPVTHGLVKLKNVKEFKCTDLFVTEDVLQFLRQNKDHLRKLDFTVWKKNPLNAELWRVISQMQNMEDLGIEWLEPAIVQSVPPIPQGSLPNMTGLLLTSLGYDVNLFIRFLNSLDKTKLETLIVHTNTPMICKENLFGGMVNLMNLNVSCESNERDMSKLIPQLLTVTKLKTLVISFIEAKDVLKMIKTLPQLNRIRAHGVVGTLKETEDYCKQFNRKVWLNEDLFG